MDEINREIQALGSDDREIREAAVVRITKLTGKRVGDTMCREIDKTSNPFLKKTLTLALGYRGDARAVDGLAKYLEEGDPETALSAINSLAIINDYHVVHLLILALSNKFKEVRRRAADLLKSRDITFGDAFVDAMERRRGGSDRLAQIEDVRIIAPLLKARVSRNIEMRWAAHDVLSRLGDFAVETFIEALRTRNKKVKREVAGYLGKLGDMRALQPITEMLADENADVRSDAVIALGALGHPDSFDYIISSLRDPKTAEAAVEALGLFGGEQAFDALIKIIDTKDMAIKNAVLKTLGKMGETRCLDKLFDLERKAKNPKLKQAVLTTVEQIVNANRALEDSVAEMRCSHCFSKFAGFVHKYSLFKKYSFYACSECKSSLGTYGIEEIVAVIDNQMEESAVREGGTLIVNWLANKRPFEFDELRILEAEDADVREFIKIAVIESKMESFRNRMKSVTVTFGAGLSLSDETMNDLKKIFKVAIHP
ncbi:MAG: HEAT repeat domain-containing protein [Firmicutes bacterium]|nr:HEAT repeat domain-containing protein [Bacillota bacterium]